METRAGYLSVGMAVIIILIGAIGFVLWLAGQDSATSYQRYGIDFKGDVTGLREGSGVSYRGIGVGQVVDLRIAPDNVEMVRVTIEIDAETPIKIDTFASLGIQGLAGGALVQLSGGTQDSAHLPIPDEGLAFINSHPSDLERLLQGAPALIDRIDLLVSHALLLLNEPNRAAIGTVLANAATVSDSLVRMTAPTKKLLADLAAAVQDVQRAAANLQVVSGELEEGVPLVLDQLNKTLKTADVTFANASNALAAFERASGAIGGAGSEMQAMVAENRVPIRDFTHVTLYDTNAFVAELRELAISLRQVATNLDRDPGGFLFGNQQRGYDAQ